jgi:hypothetical protein
MVIKWKKSSHGCVASVCGQWSIVPRMTGSRRPSGYYLKRGCKFMTRQDTQKECKRVADEILTRAKGTA